MKLFKSDYRYKLHNQGFHHIIQFAWHYKTDSEMFRKIIRELEEMYGPHTETVFAESGITYRKWNENWRCEQVQKCKRRRIYLKNEMDATLILLKVQQ
jgi:hypothetical protein